MLTGVRPIDCLLSEVVVIGLILELLLSCIDLKPELKSPAVSPLIGSTTSAFASVVLALGFKLEGNKGGGINPFAAAFIEVERCNRIPESSEVDVDLAFGTPTTSLLVLADCALASGAPFLIDDFRFLVS